MVDATAQAAILVLFVNMDIFHQQNMFILVRVLLIFMIINVLQKLTHQ
jgi:hypothetical protein